MLFIPFMNEVVNSGNLIMFIIIDALLCIVSLESKLLDHFKDFLFGWDRILANDQSLVLTDRLILLEPPMPANVFCGKASVRVSVQHFRKDVPAILRYKLR